ncbi:MAG: RagB/SusD family nutrient uptake outer membrane protein [Chlorobi bacterium]|nr:RagB/SusD family nutrient uptake outer membrane protein [Chlorobiota bacterium]
MKNIFKISIKALLLLGFVFITSCGKDFLDLKPQQSVDTESALQTLDDFKAAITGVYDQMQNANYYGRYFVLLPDIMSEDVKQNASANRAKEWAEYNGTATDFIPENLWSNFYQVVDRANRIINKDIEVPGAVKDEYDQIKGEALALRALTFFDLCRIYAQHYTYTADASHPGIPIVTEIDPSLKPARNTVKEVYDQVIKDMNDAIPLMKVNPGSDVTLSQTAVKALLARVYLYKEDWANAAAMADAVISSGDYTLATNANYLDVFNTTDPSSVENIFEISMIPTDNNGSNALGGMYLNTGYGDYLPSRDLYDTIPDGDVRKQLFSIDNTLSGIYDSIRVAKYPDVNGYNNTKVIRLSEIYLIRAEANYHLGNEAAAQADVTLIRQRGLPSAPAVTTTGQALLDDILHERRIELCYEGQRLWDLTRYKKGVHRVKQCTSVVCDIPYPSDRFVLPIPQAEIDVNPNIVQNSGY